MVLSEDVLIIPQEEGELFVDWRIDLRVDKSDLAKDVAVQGDLL